ncbi:MAG TPA: hypothetical protein VNW50_00655 [Streptosporangiaceae bacterium]|jgi:hypothetical protein|nr:hypothetical protein [Streptosporangiaceae bacterium]
MKRILGRSIAAATGAALCLLATGLPASAAPGAGSHPAVTHFRASVTSLPASGGNVRLSATVRHGSECVFTSSPRLHGLPARVSCRRASVNRTVHLPANAAAGKKTYKFGLTVSGRGGKAVARPVTVVVREAAPAVTQVAMQPSDLPSAGGATALSALVSRSATCTVSATPAVAGLPVTMPCAAGSTAVRVLVPLTLPALSGAAAQKYSLTLKVTGPGGATTESASGSVWPAMKFSGPVTVDAPAGWLGTVSCTSSSFCMGMDVASGSALRWNGTSWSAPVRIETGPYLDAGYDMHLSCVSAAFCLAVDANGNSFTYDGTSWSPAASIGLDATAVSCATSTFCMATAGGQAAVFNGSAWSAPVTISNADQIESLSCPSDSFCMAVSAAGLAYTYSTSGWSSSVNAAAPIPLVQVSCADTTFCVAVSSTGRAYFYNGSWSGPAILNASGSMDGVTCPLGTTFCLALSDGSYYTTDDGTTWTGATSLETGKPSVGSCASTTSCMVTDGSSIFVLSGTSWTQSAAPGGPLHGFTYSVSCPTPSYCVAVDWSGAYLVYNGKTWSSPRTIGSQASAVDSVSCSSPSFCMAVDASDANGLGGNIFIFNGHSWQYEGQDGLPLSSVSCTGPDFCEMLSEADGSVDTATWNGTNVRNGSLDTWLGFGPEPEEGFVSCATSTFCVAVDKMGNAFTFDGSTWSKATALVPGWTASMTGISCPTTTFCVAIDAGGNQYTFNGGTWTAQDTIDTAGIPQAISCTVSHFCLMGDLNGNVATFNGATWSATSNVDPVTTANTGLTGASCADAADCVAVDWEGNALTGTG